MKRAEIWWTSLEEPKGSAPGFRRPMLIIQCNEFNDSAIRTVAMATITSNLNLERSPGNVLIRKKDSGLLKDSVVNVSQIVTVDKGDLTECAGSLSPKMMKRVEDGLKLVLGIS